MIDRCLTISTTHVTKKDVILLWWSTDEEREEQYGALPVLSAHETGLFCVVTREPFRPGYGFTDEEIREVGISESFIKVMNYAHAQDCYLIHLDGLGEVIDSPLLDNHHWDMEDNKLWDLSTDDIQDINEVMNKL